MMKIIFVCLFFVCLAGMATAQDMKTFKLYHPEENAEAGLKKAISAAKAAGKHVFVQIGGNWCIWCARFHEFTTTDKQLDSLINANYVVYHVNYSKENNNKALLAKFDYPQRFGFPVFVVLDGNGKRIHTQDSGLLEEGKGYDRRKVSTFFENWAPKALAPEQYKNY